MYYRNTPLNAQERKKMKTMTIKGNPKPKDAVNKGYDDDYGSIEDCDDDEPKKGTRKSPSENCLSVFA